jgi:hypothetical protein
VWVGDDSAMKCVVKAILCHGVEVSIGNCVGSVCEVEEAGVQVGLWTPVGRDVVVGCWVVGSVRTLETLLEVTVVSIEGYAGL